MIDNENIYYSSCRLCARECGVDRTRVNGGCGVGSELLVARASLHAWEEPPISGTRGSGTIFFSGCSLGCSFCQNREISGGRVGKTVTTDRLADIMLELEGRGAHNINLVTPTHYVPSIIRAIDRARGLGLTLPIVYNTSSIDTPDTLRMLEGYVDIYLADYKYNTEKTAQALTRVKNYTAAARLAIAEMVRQRPTPTIEDGLMKSGVIVRLLLLPAHVAEAKLSVKYLYETYGDSIIMSLMSQYTPMEGVAAPLDRPVTAAEYDELVAYALRKGVKNAYIQEDGAARESFIPPFDLTGV